MIDNLASVGILLDRGLTYSLAASVAHKQPGTGLACKQIDECGRLHTPPFCVVADVEVSPARLQWLTRHSYAAFRCSTCHLVP
jgi:hypothetical protein